MNRAQRRRQLSPSSSEHQHFELALPLELAIMCNNDDPVPGLDVVLHEIRAEVGLNVMVSLCGECCSVVVL